MEDGSIEVDNVEAYESLDQIIPTGHKFLQLVDFLKAADFIINLTFK